MNNTGKPIPLISIGPRSLSTCRPRLMSICAVFSLQWMRPATPLLSMRLAVFTVSPNRQYLGIRLPTTPAITEPECMPMRMRIGEPSANETVRVNERR